KIVLPECFGTEFRLVFEVDRELGGRPFVLLTTLPCLAFTSLADLAGGLGFHHSRGHNCFPF
ncbi:MAG: hypothetical protein AABZ55_06160, partial [Bdellovibrionota bacterium]